MSMLKNMDIKFDINCFTPEFQNYIFKKANVDNYFDFINKYNNNFSFSLIQSTPYINLLQVEENCSFQNISEEIKENEEDLIISEDQLENVEETIKKITYEEETIDTLDENTESESEELEMEDTNHKFSYVVENDKIHLKSDKKFITKKISKKFRRNNGYWNKKKNEWIFPLSAKKFIDSFSKNEESSSNFIQDIKQEENRVIITPLPTHPKFGTSVIYDKSGNIGIWDSNLKGWIFNKI